MDKPEVVAWVIAAEGCFSICKASENSILPRISISNTDIDFVTKFKDLVGYGSIGHQKYRNPNWKQGHYWIIQSYTECLRFCTEVAEYMPIKQEQVMLMIEFCARGVIRKRSDGQRGFKGAEPKDWEIHARMKVLNKKGKGGNDIG